MAGEGHSKESIKRGVKKIRTEEKPGFDQQALSAKATLPPIKKD